jgi:hypothetical protein
MLVRIGVTQAVVLRPGVLATACFSALFQVR